MTIETKSPHMARILVAFRHELPHMAWVLPPGSGTVQASVDESSYMTAVPYDGTEKVVVHWWTGGHKRRRRCENAEAAARWAREAITERYRGLGRVLHGDKVQEAALSLVYAWHSDECLSNDENPGTCTCPAGESNESRDWIRSVFGMGKAS